MGNANGRDEAANGRNGDDDSFNGGGRSNGDFGMRGDYAPAPDPMASSEFMENNSSPPSSPRRAVSPILFGSQVPVAPLRRGDGSPFYPQMWPNDSREAVDSPPERGIPTMITWSYGGSNVAVEGSWDNWNLRRVLQRSGKDFTVLLVLPSGVYHYKFIVDGEWRYIPDLPFVADEMGRICNLLDVHDHVPEILDSVAEFDVPSSPDSTYSQAFPTEEDFAKEPAIVPSQLNVTVLGMENSDEASSSKPQHVVLNHLFMEKGWPSQSVVALGLTHRFQSKYVTVVLYKPLKK